MVMTTQNEIAQRVVESILAQQLAPGARLGEQELADLFQVSRTMVREALMQLQARGFVEVRPRRGWYVVEPSVAEARDAFAARRMLQLQLLTRRNDPAPTETWGQDTARVLASASDAASGRRLQNVLKALLRK